MNASLARILLRYGVGFLAGVGVFSSDVGAALASDPDVQFYVQSAITVLIGAATEAWYYAAKKFGWAT